MILSNLIFKLFYGFMVFLWFLILWVDDSFLTIYTQSESIGSFWGEIQANDLACNEQKTERTMNITSFIERVYEPTSEIYTGRKI